MAKSAKELFSDVGFIFKFVETLICLAMIILDLLMECEYELHLYKCIIVCYAGYFIICFTFFIIYIVDETHHLMEMILIGGGGVFFIITGIFFLVTTIKNMAICHFVMIVLIFANGIIMIVDLVREATKK